MIHTTLEEASDLITDGTHGSPQRTEDANGVPLLSAKNVFDGEIRWNEFDRVPLSEWEEFNKRVSLKRGDVLMTCVGTIGRAAVWLNEKPVVFFRSVAIIRPKPTLISGYLEYVIRSDDFQSELRRRTKRSSQGGVYLKDIKTMPIAVPPLADQERIVKLLDEADELRKLRTKTDLRTAALIQSLFHEMFGDPDTNPFDWPVKCAGDLMDACDYGTSQKANEDGRGIPILRMGNVTTDGSLDLKELKSVELADGELAKQRLQVGDVLFNRTNSRELVGKTGMWDGRFEAVPASYFIRVRFRPNAEHPQHFTTFMNLFSMKRRLAEMARGAVGQANINSKELKSIEFPVPPVKLQCEFAARVSDIRAMQTEQAASRRRLDELFQSMLHRAFKGEL